MSSEVPARGSLMPEDAARLLDDFPDALIVVTPDGRVTFWSEGAERMFGYTPADIVGRNLGDAIMPGEHSTELEAWTRAASGGPGTVYETVRRRKDGTMIIVDASVRAIRGPDGAVRYLAIAKKDVTHLKYIRESEVLKARFQGLLDAAPDAMVLVNRDGRIVLTNDETEKLFGYAPSELIGEPVDLLVPERFREEHPAHRAGYFAEPRRRSMGGGAELAGRRRDGSEFPAEISLSPIRTEDGRLLATAAIRDVTGRRKAEARLKGLLESAPDAMIVVRRDGRIVLVNSQTERLFGYTRDEMVNQPVELLVPEALRARHPEMRTGYFDDPRPRSMGAAGVALSARRKDGTEFPAEISLSPLEAEEGTLVSAAVRDVTDRKRLEQRRADAVSEQYRADLGKAEEQLRRSQKMEAVGRLAGGIAHDFNNLLTAILGYSELALARLDERDPLHRDLKEIRKAGERAGSLTRQLLVFSRHEIVKPQILDVNAVVQDLDRMLRRLIGEDVDLRVSIDRGLGQVKLDRGYLEQVIVNLSVNARDAMPGGGALTIETTNVSLAQGASGVRGDVKPGRYVMIAVSDTGSGMTSEVLAHIFEPFFTTKESGKGTGLGLSTVYGIVEGGGGHIGVYTELGRGSVFKVYLPRVDEAVSQTARVVPPTRTSGTETILLVEDEELVRNLAHHVLSDRGYRVLVASSGGEAFYLCEQRPDPIHLLVTDVVMPGLSGPELAARLQAERPDLKVLYMSGYTGGALQHTAALASGHAFLQKPFTPIALAQAVRQVLDTR